jgi:hypothetical protein
MDEEIVRLLAPFRNEVPQAGPSPLDAAQLGLTDGERRAFVNLRSGLPLRECVEQLKRERVAQGRDTLRAIFIAVSAGAIRLPSDGA